LVPNAHQVVEKNTSWPRMPRLPRGAQSSRVLAEQPRGRDPARAPAPPKISRLPRDSAA
jgi:hypothetical protein